MSSVFFSPAARNALTVLNGVERTMDRSQNAVATGKRIATAADNPAIWAVSQQLQSDQASYAALSQTLSTGKAVTAVGRTAAEEVVSLLGDLKTEIIAATEDGANTSAVQSRIDDLADQIDGIVASARLNGVNLLENIGGAAEASFTVLGSVYSGSNGAIQTHEITVAKQDLQSDALQFGATAASATDYFNVASANVAGGGGATQNIDIASNVVAGASYRVTLSADSGGAHAFGAAPVDFEYVARRGDTAADVAAALQQRIADHVSANDLSTSMSVSYDASNARITIANLDTEAADALEITTTAATGGVAGGGLEGLQSIDVTSSGGRDDALVAIETLIDTATNAAATFGAAENRIDRQSDYLASASLAVGNGISALVDADLNEEAARQAALQSQRALALEMLSIANNRTASVLSLFNQPGSVWA